MRYYWYGVSILTREDPAPLRSRAIRRLVLREEMRKENRKRKERVEIARAIFRKDSGPKLDSGPKVEERRRVRG